MNELQIVNPNTKLIAFYQTTRHGFIWSTQRERLGRWQLADITDLCNEMPPIYFAMVKVWTVVLKWRHMMRQNPKATLSAIKLEQDWH
jgi:hypothetical protein